MPRIKQGKLRVKSFPELSEVESLRKELKQSRGIVNFEVDVPNRLLRFTYNLEVNTLAHIERIVEQHGIRLDLSFPQNLKRQIVHFTEQNEWENARRRKVICSGQPDSITKSISNHRAVEK